MRKIIESTLVSLDGVFESPHVWATEYFDHEGEQYALDLLLASDAMLMGRKTYESSPRLFRTKGVITAVASTRCKSTCSPTV
jgi:dihydrofolate reductase